MGSSPSTSLPAMRIFSCALIGSFGFLTRSCMRDSVPTADRSCNRARALHAKLDQNLGDGRQRAPHVLRIQPADAAYTEAVGHRELPRIDDVAAILQLVIEALEH